MVKKARHRRVSTYPSSHCKDITFTWYSFSKLRKVVSLTFDVKKKFLSYSPNDTSSNTLVCSRICRRNVCNHQLAGFWFIYDLKMGIGHNGLLIFKPGNSWCRKTTRMNRHGDVIALGAFQGNLTPEQGDNSKRSFSNLVFAIGLSLLGF